MSKPKPNPQKSSGRPANSYARYSGLAFQMLGTILLFTYAGYKLDEWQENQIPLWTLLFSLGSIAASLYMFIRSISKEE
ncbi:AtpZ/AtpI family protein [Arundinibacter roseus]|uniref:AtpZ/AtpI family protein n=1 Tax=Arundinibacter roseus TaxID=2070510 RepID=A0A4R4KEB2_9BACT|nr:AtpZ/AtpI family protein [Arundinibacter roseus]TDB65142.1 AtpZ/AtpI family protein [Arundinibacter roseus]